MLICLATPAMAEVSGTVVNKSTNKPQAGAVVTLYSLGQQGMNPVTAVKTDESGAFSVDHNPQGPHLVQTIFDGAVYSKMIQPGGSSSGLEIEVFDATNEETAVSVEQHMVLVEPMGGILHINESVVMRNSGLSTYNDTSKGTLQIYISPEKQGEPRLMVTGPQGMPVQRDPSASGEENVYQIDYPIRPGETRFDLTYVLPQSDPLVFSSKVLHDGEAVRLVSPAGVTLSGDDVNQIGEEPQTHAKVYEVLGKEYSVNVAGSGSLRDPNEAAAPSGGASIEQIRARVYNRVEVIVGLAMLVLLAGFIMLYRRPEVAPASGPSKETRTKTKAHAKGKRA
jgi:hypothetical protein